MKNKESGQGLVDYELILALFGTVLTVILSILGPAISEVIRDFACAIGLVTFCS